MSDAAEPQKSLSLESIITNVVQVPGVRVDRKKFLADIFSDEGDSLPKILEQDPIQAGISQKQLSRMGDRLILTRTSESSLASFAAGLPGGWAMAATIPADVIQYFGMTLRLAQELSYLYGAQDLWQNGEVDDEKVRNQLILYCGVMFGVSGAAAGVRLFSARIARAALEKIPRQALAKTLWYPLIQKIGVMIGVKITKTTFAQGFSKAIPIVGGVISGGINFTSMMKMANRLQNALDAAAFDYSEAALNADFQEVAGIDREDIPAESLQITPARVKIHPVRRKKPIARNPAVRVPISQKSESEDAIFRIIEKLADLKDREIITPEEFISKKTELLARL